MAERLSNYTLGVGRFVYYNNSVDKPEVGIGSKLALVALVPNHVRNLYFMEVIRRVPRDGIIPRMANIPLFYLEELIRGTPEFRPAAHRWQLQMMGILVTQETVDIVQQLNTFPLIARIDTSLKIPQTVVEYEDANDALAMIGLTHLADRWPQIDGAETSNYFQEIRPAEVDSEVYCYAQTAIL